MQILVVDDDAMVLESCRRILEQEKMVVHLAENADKAQAVMETETPFDLMLTDMKMPGKDGFQLLCQAREKFPGIAVLMMTGYLIPETIQKGVQRGADGFVAKPFTPEELIEAVHKAVWAAKTRKDR